MQQHSCYSCLDMETSCRDGGCRDMFRVSGRTSYFVNSGEVLLMRDASDNLASDDVASDDVSSGALLQTRYFRRASSDAYLQMHFFRRFQLQINFLCSLTCSIRIFVDITLIIDPVHLNTCLAYPIDNF